MAAHVRKEHTNCRDERCGYCRGGLFTCAVCGASEGELPSDCPGTNMTGKQRDAVMGGDIDFRGGEWVSLRHYPDGKPLFSSTGMMLTADGARSVFDDVDE